MLHIVLYQHTLWTSTWDVIRMLAGDVTFFYITDHIRLSLISYFETSTGCCIGTSLESWWGAPEDASMGRPLVLNRRPSGDVHRTCFGKFRRTSFGVVPRKFSGLSSAKWDMSTWQAENYYSQTKQKNRRSRIHILLAGKIIGKTDKNNWKTWKKTSLINKISKIYWQRATINKQI